LHTKPSTLSILRLLASAFVAFIILLIFSANTGANSAPMAPTRGRSTSAAVTRTPRPTSGTSRLTPSAYSQQSGSTATALAGQLNATATAFTVKAGATLTALAVNVKITATVPANEAATVITNYASEVLETQVSVKKASGLTADITRTLTQTSAGSDAQAAASDLAVQSYGATLSNGAASLSYGTGTISGYVSVDVQNESLGVYSLYVNSAVSLDAAGALSLAKATFPGLAGLSYTAYTVETGFAWYSMGYVPVIDAKTHQVITTAQGVILYVLPGKSGKSTVTATVGRGQYATLIEVSGK
jgi:hypothetical protein